VTPLGGYRSTHISSIKRFFAGKIFFGQKKKWASAKEMSDEAGRQAWLANLRAQFVGDGEGGHVLGGGYQVAQAETGGPGAASAVLQPLPAFAAGPAANFAGWQPVPRPISQPVPAAADAVPLAGASGSGRCSSIVTTGNTSLGDDLVDKTVVLRMNENFMKFMHLKYPTIVKKKNPTFGTVITVKFQPLVLSSPSLTTRKMMSRWTLTRYTYV